MENENKRNLEEKLINFFYSQTNKNAPKINQEDLIDLTELFNNQYEYYIALMNIIKFRFRSLNNIQKITILIQIKNFLSKILHEKKSYNLPDLQNNALQIANIFCDFEVEKKIKCYLKIIILKIVRINMNQLNNKNSRGIKT